MSQSLCPWWLGYFLLSPLRKRRQDPEKILSPYIKKDMKVVDFGSAMGYFSLPIASMVGESGKVFCFDIQKKMLDKLVKRSVKAGVEDIIEPVLIDSNDRLYDNYSETADFILLFAVAHEVQNKEKMFGNLFKMLKKNGELLFSEPKGHVSKEEFEKSVSIAEKTGFEKINALEINYGHSILMGKK